MSSREAVDELVASIGTGNEGCEFYSNLRQLQIIRPTGEWKLKNALGL